VKRPNIAPALTVKVLAKALNVNADQDYEKQRNFDAKVLDEYVLRNNFGRLENGGNSI